MYWWNVGALKNDLARGAVDQTQAFQYLLATNFLTALAAVPGHQANRWDLVGSGGTLLVTLLGTFYCYRRNGGRHGGDLFLRFFALGWIVSVRAVVLMILPTIVFLVLLEITGLGSKETNPREVLWFFVIEVGVFWRVGVHMADVAARSSGAAAIPGAAVPMAGTMGE